MHAIFDESVRPPAVLLPRLPTLVAFALLLGAGSAHAQIDRPTGTSSLPPTSVAAPDGALALEVDPAALAYLPRFGFVYAHGRPPSGTGLRGVDALYAGGSVGGRFGFGVGFERLLGTPPDEHARGRFSFAAAIAADRRVAMGFALRHLVSGASPYGSATSLDLSLSLRPSTRLALALLVQDVLGPLGLIHANGSTLPATFVLAAAMRPFGTDTFTIEAAGLANTDGTVGARFFAALALPHLGRLVAQTEVQDLGHSAVVRALAGLDLRWGGLSVASGVITAEHADVGWWGAVAYQGEPLAGVPGRRYVAELDVRGGVGARRILEIVLALDRAAHDPDVTALLLRLRRTDLGLAYAQELRQMIAMLERDGKHVVCHLESPTGAELYACTGASAVLGDPAGHVRLLGPSVDVMRLGALLDTLGLHADFVRIGPYKSAPEELTDERMSDAAREQEEALLDDLYARLVQDLAAGRERDRAAARAWIDGGPYTVPGAVTAGLLDGSADATDLGGHVDETLGRHVRRRSLDTRLPTRSWGVPRRVGVVIVDGSIVDGDNVDVPFIGVHQSGGRTVVRAIDELASDPSVAAIVVRADSGGGAALASDQIWRAIRRARQRKPVVASMGSVAASGGYYLASAATEIFTDPSTVTGSIGIFYGKVDVAELADRLGVHVEQLRRGAHAGALSLFRPFSDDERARLEALVREGYELFLSRVAEGRGMTTEAVDALGQGRVWSGDAAVANGLADHLGGFGAALARARDLGNLDASAEVVFVPERPSTLLDYVLGDDGESMRSAIPERLAAHIDLLAFLLAQPEEGAMLALRLDEGPPP